MIYKLESNKVSIDTLFLSGRYAINCTHKYMADIIYTLVHSWMV